MTPEVWRGGQYLRTWEGGVGDGRPQKWGGGDRFNTQKMEVRHLLKLP